MGTGLALEFWIPSGKAVNRLPSRFQQKIITSPLLSPKQGPQFSWHRKGDHEIGDG